DRFLAFSPQQHPIVLQLGGSNVENLAKAAKLSDAYGYDEINLNCGCPSPKVAGHGCFGVSLMLKPKLVGEAMSAIAANTSVPVTVKCRIGVDDHDSYDELYCTNTPFSLLLGDFVYKVSTLSPTRHFIIHSRKALLGGISPADNRRIPPLKYEYYYALVRDFPDLGFTINGGITSVSKVNAALKEGAHGVMVGRAAYNKYVKFSSIGLSSISYFFLDSPSILDSPWQMLGPVDTAVYGVPSSGLTRRQVLEQYQVYGDSVLGTHGNGRPNVRDLVKSVGSLLEESLMAIPDSVLDSPISGTRESVEEDVFANVHNVLPPRYEAGEQIILCA
ncbi:hypothetical protein CARUB_v10019526mg, partial [Capsella rubella]